MKDLALVVADKDMDLSLRAVLVRPESLSIRPLTWSVLSHPNRDGGVRSGGDALLSRQARTHSHGMLVLDLEGSGANDLTAVELERILTDRLRPLWQGRARAIVIEPELDVWMWGNDDLLRDVLDWPEDTSLRRWLTERGFVFRKNGKPERPKEAMEALMKRMRKPRSSSLYREIAGQISLARCTDPAFARLREQLQTWFPDTHGVRQ